MEKTFKLILKSTILILLFNFSITYGEQTLDKQNIETQVTKPTNNENDFDKKIIQKRDYFEKLIKDYGISYYKSNIKYNKITEKELKLLIMNLYQEDKKYIEEYFKNNFHTYCEKSNCIQKILNSIPQAKNIYDNEIIENSGLLGWLVGYSFNIDFNYDEYDSLLESIKNIIEIHKQRNGFYPSFEEIRNEELFTNGKSIKLLEIQDEIKYELKVGNKIIDIQKQSDYSINDIELVLEYKQDLFDIDEAKKLNQKIMEENNIKLSDYKKYEELIKGIEIPQIPEIYKKIPNDSILIHIKNPQIIFELLQTQGNKYFSNIEIINKIKDKIVNKIGIQDWETIKNNIKGEILIVINDLDIISPNIVFIMEEDDVKRLNINNNELIIEKDNGKNYIGTNKTLLKNFLENKIENSLFESSDFKYAWSKHGKQIVDSYFFVGDKFFEKFNNLEEYILLSRKTKDYLKLVDLQYYVYGYQKLTGKKLENLDELGNFANINPEIIKDFYIKDNIVNHSKIGNINKTNNYKIAGYEIDKITKKELNGYQNEILGYRQIWSNNLDPISIVLNKNNDGFVLDFIMTPLPNFDDIELNELINSFKGYGIDNFDIIQDNRYRLGTIGILLGADIQKIREDTKSNKSNIQKQINEFFEFINQNILEGDDILRYLGNEIHIGIGDIDKSFFVGWDTEKFDAFLSIEFTSYLKAQEFLQKIFKFLGKEFGINNFGDINKIINEGIIKPLIIEFEGHNIYNIPIGNLLYSNINIYYTILDNILYISLSKTSIEKTIAHFNEPSKDNKLIFQNIDSKNKKMFSFYFDNEKFGQFVEKISQFSKESYLFLGEFANNFLSSINIGKIIGNYYYEKDLGTTKDKKIDGINIENNYYKIYSKQDEIFLKIYKEKINIEESLKNEILSEFDNKIPQIFSESGINIDDIIEIDDYLLQEIEKLFGVIEMSQKEKIKGFFNNYYHTINIDNNEIQLQLNSIGNVAKKESKKIEEKIELTPILEKIGKDNLLYILGIGGPIGLVLITIIYMIGIKKKDEFK